MSVLSWVKLTVCLWLLRKAVRLAGWLLDAAGDRRVARPDRPLGPRAPARTVTGLTGGT
jgi:hypothetical protein